MYAVHGKYHVQSMPEFMQLPLVNPSNANPSYKFLLRKRKGRSFFARLARGELAGDSSLPQLSLSASE